MGLKDVYKAGKACYILANCVITAVNPQNSLIRDRWADLEKTRPTFSNKGGGF